MKKRRILLFSLVGLTLLVCVSAGLLVRVYRQEQAGRELILAIKANDTQRALTALRAHADPNAHDHGDVPPSLSGYLSKLWQQMRGVKPPEHGPESTALTLSVEQNNTALVEALLARGARDDEKSNLRPNEPQFPWYVPLLLVAVTNRNPAIVQALVRHGSDVNVIRGGPPVMIYAQDAATARMLLQCGANVDAVDDMGDTALLSKLDGGSSAFSAEVTQVLLDHGAKVDVQGTFGLTPLLVAAHGGTNPVAQEGGREGVMSASFLLSHRYRNITLDDLPMSLLLSERIRTCRHAMRRRSISKEEDGGSFFGIPGPRKREDRSGIREELLVHPTGNRIVEFEHIVGCRASLFECSGELFEVAHHDVRVGGLVVFIALVEDDDLRGISTTHAPVDRLIVCNL